MRNKTTGFITKVGMLSAIALALMWLEIPLPLFPAFLRIDFSDVPALIGGFAMGPVAALVIELIKNGLHFVLKNDGTGGIGNLANFIVGAALVVPAAWYYVKHKNRKGAYIGMSFGVVSMIIAAVLMNWYVLIPLYGKLMGLEAVWGMAQEANKNIVDIKSYIVMAIVPFNFIKALITCLIAAFAYKKLSPLLHK